MHCSDGGPLFRLTVWATFSPARGHEAPPRSTPASGGLLPFLVDEPAAISIWSKPLLRIESAITQLGRKGPAGHCQRRRSRFPSVPTLPLRKGVSHSLNRQSAMDEARRISLLTAVAKSRHWIETILEALDFGAIGKHEKLAERHLRFLALLAYLSPRIIEAIAEGRALLT